MSLLPLDDLDPTLSDVLAFLDDFDRSDSDPSAVDAAAVKRKKSRAAASRRFQQKKKAELLTLREQVAALQRRLQQLQAGRRRYGKAPDETQKRKVVAAWIGRAELEKCRRLEAETHNRQLKAVLARQKHTATVVKHLLQNVTAVVHIEEGLRTPGPVARLGHFVPSLDDAIYADLASKMDRMYLDADDVFSTRSRGTRLMTDAVEISGSDAVR